MPKQVSNWTDTQRYLDQLSNEQQLNRVPSRLSLKYGKRAKKSTIEDLLENCGDKLTTTEKANLQKYLNSNFKATTTTAATKKTPLQKADVLLRKWGKHPDQIASATANKKTYNEPAKVYKEPTKTYSAAKVNKEQVKTMTEKEMRDKLLDEWRQKTANEWHGTGRLDYIKSVGNGL